jgi:hypothetical protein
MNRRHFFHGLLSVIAAPAVAGVVLLAGEPLPEKEFHFHFTGHLKDEDMRRLLEPHIHWFNQRINEDTVKHFHSTCGARAREAVNLP